MLRLLRLLVLGYWHDKPVPPKPEKPRSCRGYTAGNGVVVHCNGDASPLCWSSRCRGCCYVVCKCEHTELTREEANLIRAHREERKALLEAIK